MALAAVVSLATRAESLARAFMSSGSSGAARTVEKIAIDQDLRVWRARANDGGNLAGEGARHDDDHAWPDCFQRFLAVERGAMTLFHMLDQLRVDQRRQLLGIEAAMQHQGI